MAGAASGKMDIRRARRVSPFAFTDIRNSSLLLTLQMQAEIISAIVRHEIRAKTVGSRLGPILLILEPTLFMVFYYVLRLALGVSYSRHGMTMAIILITGYLTHFALRNAASAVSLATHRMSNVLIHPLVTVMDGIIARAIVYWFVYSIVLIFISCGAIIFVGTRPPGNLPLVLLGFLLSFWMGVSLGILFGSVERFIPFAKIPFTLLARANLYLSGGMYTAAELPPKLRAFVSWNPSLHIVELMREGWVTTYVSPTANLPMVLTFLVILTFLALAGERAGRYYRLT